MYEVLEHGAAIPVFLDTSALVAYFYSNDQHRRDAIRFFRGVQEGRYRARPLYTNDYVIDELLTTLVSRSTHSQAVDALTSLRESQYIRILPVTTKIFDSACTQFSEYTDHEVSFTDHVIAVQAQEHGVEHVVSFDQDFERLGLSTLTSSA